MFKKIFRVAAMVWWSLLAIALFCISTYTMVADIGHALNATRLEGYVYRVEKRHARGPDYFRYDVYTEAGGSGRSYVIDDDRWFVGQAYTTGEDVTFYAANGSDYAKFHKGLTFIGWVGVGMSVAALFAAYIWLPGLFKHKKIIRLSVGGRSKLKTSRKQ